MKDLPYRLSIAAALWGIVLLAITVFSKDLEELLWIFYDPLLIGVVWLAGIVILVLSVLRIRKHHFTAIACLVIVASGSIALIGKDYLAVNLRFRLSQTHYEERLQKVLPSAAGAQEEDVAGVEGNRVAFY